MLFLFGQEPFEDGPYTVISNKNADNFIPLDGLNNDPKGLYIFIILKKIKPVITGIPQARTIILCELSLPLSRYDSN